MIFVYTYIYTARGMNEKYTVNVDWDKFKNCQCEWTVIFYLKNSAEWEFFLMPSVYCAEKNTKQTMFFVVVAVVYYDVMLIYHWWKKYRNWRDSMMCVDLCCVVVDDDDDALLPFLILVLFCFFFRLCM
jgi:hypothetical protein